MSAKKKLNSLQILRTISQIILFVFLPCLYASAFLGIKTMYLGFINGNLDFAANFVSYIEVIAIIPVTILFGRFFCGWMCAFGSVSDWIYAFSKRIFKINFKVPEKADRVLKIFKYIYLVLLISLLYNTNWNLLSKSNPWDAFGYIFTVKSIPDIAGAFQYFSLGTILLLIILAQSMIIERFFCRYLCPLGAIFSLTSRFRILKIRKNRDKCGSCKICTSNCPMGIPMYKYDKISTGECIQCQRCINVCPRKNTALSIFNQAANPLMVAVLAIGAMLSLYYIAGLLDFSAEDSASLNAYGSDFDSSYSQPFEPLETEEPAKSAKTPEPFEQSETTKSPQADSAAGYIDGIYEGSGTGFHGGTTSVSVTIEDQLISNIEILSHEDDRPYFSRAENEIIPQIIDTQSEDADSVSGATFSSNGIISAVKSALSNAKG